MNFMGYVEGLIAMGEEPDEVMALFSYLSDFYCAVTEKSIEYYRPDVFEICDDTASAQNPFISPEMFRHLIKPFYEKLAAPARNVGIPIMIHCCGHCEAFIPDWFDFGVSIWNPAQIMNDLSGIKNKYGNKLVLTGCWDSSGPAGWPDATEELIKQAVRDTIDKYATGGGFCFWGSIYGPKDDENVKLRKRWLAEEYEAYRETPYQ
jgi:hypothetical protein